ncbi:MAG: glycosyltransferase [Nanoarchaeota archaeon]|nr:glycosyltransferase [Nanoarchaeota archaeon]
MDLNSKKVLLVGWGTDNEEDYFMYQGWYLTLKKIFPGIQRFDTKKNYFRFGKDKMNEMLISFISGSNFDLIIFVMDEEELYPETILKISELKPNIKTMFTLSDDDVRFDHYSRYFAPLFDYVVTSQDFVKQYEKEGNSASFHLDYNPAGLGKMDIPQIYDICFVGRPKSDRAEILKYLIKNGVKVTLFGWDWYEDPELSGVFKGHLNQKDYAKVINQSKINLSLTKTGYSEEKPIYNIKGRFFEIALCHSFQIAEYFKDIEKFFKEDKEIVLFRTKEELLKKVKYYLKDDKKRLQIAENSYKKVKKKFYRETELRKIIIKIFKQPKRKIGIPKFDRSLYLIKENDFFIPKEDLKKKLQNIDYIHFYKKDVKNSMLKTDFQIYSLEVTGKKISCCDYYAHSDYLGNYLRLRTNFAFKRIGKDANKLISINQLMADKDYFIENIDSFKKIFYDKPASLLSHENTAFISFPLTSIKHINYIDYESMIKSFDITYIKRLYSLIYQKKVLTDPLIYAIIMKYFAGRPFMLKYLVKAVSDKHNWDKMSVNRTYAKNSILEKFTRKI